MAANDETCKTCTWYRPIDANDGRCHRVPPTIFLLPHNKTSWRPEVIAEDWCGEWKTVKGGEALRIKALNDKLKGLP